MTWAKFGNDFPDRLAADGMSDAAFRTHTEAVMWVYHVERWDLTVPKHMLRRIAGSVEWETAVKDLVAAGYWEDRDHHYVIRHHAREIIASLIAQESKRERDRKAQAAKRERDREAQRRVSADVSADHTSIHTSSQSSTKGDEW